jgi:hypothetical protein
MRAHLVVGGFLAKVPRLTPVRVVALRAAMLGAVVALGLLLAIPAVAMAADINKSVSVDATQEAWQDTGIFLGAGDHVVIDGSGTVDLDKNTTKYDNTPPDGVAETATSNFLLPGAPVGALIGKIDSGDPFLVGDFKSIDSVASSGELYLAVNDSFFGFTDNSGQFTADIAVNHPDTQAPKVVSTFPRNGGEVGPAANIRATFSEDMQEASVLNAFKLFKKGSTNQIAATVSYDAATDIATLNPTNNLRRGVTYKAVVTTVAKDEAANRLDQDDSTPGLQQKKWFFKID